MASAGDVDRPVGGRRAVHRCMSSGTDTAVTLDSAPERGSFCPPGRTACPDGVSMVSIRSVRGRVLSVRNSAISTLLTLGLAGWLLPCAYAQLPGPDPSREDSGRRRHALRSGSKDVRHHIVVLWLFLVAAWRVHWLGVVHQRDQEGRHLHLYRGPVLPSV